MDRAASEIRCFARLLQLAGAAAPSIHRTYAAVEPKGSACDSGTAVHVHVNVCNASARGNLLSPRQILDVFCSWVRFELVSVRFARACMWREPSCLPLFATGPEFTREKAKAQATQRLAAASSASNNTECAASSNAEGNVHGSHIDACLDANCGSHDAPPEARVREGDVPAFFTQVHALLHSEGFAMLEDQAPQFQSHVQLTLYLKHSTACPNMQLSRVLAFQLARVS